MLHSYHSDISNFSHKSWIDSISHLTDFGWVEIPDFLSLTKVSLILNDFKLKLEEDSFNAAKIGHDLSFNQTIRQSETCWIEAWDTSPLVDLSLFYQNLMGFMNSYYFLSMKRWESQFALYLPGGFYKKHIDQLKGTEHRQMTLILYLNYCEKGGELVVYDRASRNNVAATISPKAGSCVLFFSSQIYHEVLPCISPRFSLTTWFRDDII